MWGKYSRIYSEFATTTKAKKFPKSPLVQEPVSNRNLLVLNIGMEDIKFVEHKINLPL
jgi:hypothetical protein